MYTEGVRKNNIVAIQAAQAVLAPLFYSSHHRIYQYVLLRDAVQRVLMPNQMEVHLEENATFSLSGAKNGGQGADFVHEELNKTVKSYMPPGQPGFRTWVRVCRNASNLVKLKRQLIPENISQRRYKKFEREVGMVRRVFRSRGYLN